MKKTYWVATYRSVSNPEALAAYAKISGPAIIAAGGRILVRGVPSEIYEKGIHERTVVIEFDSVEQAKAHMTVQPTSKHLPCWVAGPSGTFV